MSDIRPFEGLRPTKELVDKIAALPYDVMDTKEARAIVEENPWSFLSVTKSEATMKEGVDHYSAQVYARAKENLDNYRVEGAMLQDKTPCYYIYRQQMGAHIQIGLVALASVAEYEDNIIKKHELTRVDKEQDRVNHIEATQAQTGPVFLTYKSKGLVAGLLLKIMSEKYPEYDFKADDGIRHTLYVVNEPLVITEITELFKQVPAMYIADGHHRSAAAMRVSKQLHAENPEAQELEADHFLAVIFPDNMMKILPYNRMVKDLNGLTVEEFKEKILENFVLEEAGASVQPKAQHTFSMYLEGKWYSMQGKMGTWDCFDVIADLDVSILQDKVLAPLLGIGDPRTDERIAFVGGIRGLGELEQRVDSGEYAVAFVMYPTSMKELMQVADAGKIMPPKSTWFEPKLRDAMVVHLIEE